MTSQSKTDAARANGSKSRGPITPEGKARSSQNALKHGLAGQSSLLPFESEQDFENLLEAHRAHHQPVGALEEELVRSLATARWRLSRIAALEAHLFDNEMALSRKQIDDEFADIADLGRLAFVFKKLAGNGQSLSLLIRYENSLTRTCDRAFRHLLAVQKLRNEPKPEINTSQIQQTKAPERTATPITPNASPLENMRPGTNMAEIMKQQPPSTRTL